MPRTPRPSLQVLFTSCVLNNIISCLSICARWRQEPAPLTLLIHLNPWHPSPSPLTRIGCTKHHPMKHPTHMSGNTNCQNPVPPSLLDTCTTSQGQTTNLSIS